MTSLGWMLVLPVGAGILLGQLADSALGADPYATIVLFAVGLAVGLGETFRTMAAALKLIRRE
jgi:F0F1-type ATP synthase assembly protein I